MKAKFQVLAAGSLVAADQLSKLVTSSAACGAHVCPLRNDALLLGVVMARPHRLCSSVSLV